MRYFFCRFIVRAFNFRGVIFRMLKFRVLNFHNLTVAKIERANNKQGKIHPVFKRGRRLFKGAFIQGNTVYVQVEIYNTQHIMHSMGQPFWNCGNPTNHSLLEWLMTLHAFLRYSKNALYDQFQWHSFMSVFHSFYTNHVPNYCINLGIPFTILISLNIYCISMNFDLRKKIATLKILDACN